MKLKLTRIAPKSFIKIFTVINIIGGFILGAVVSVVSLLPTDDQNAGAMGPWAILLFPILNGILGAITGAFFTGIYNYLAARFGGIELEFQNLP